MCSWFWLKEVHGMGLSISFHAFINLSTTWQAGNLFGHKDMVGTTSYSSKPEKSRIMVKTRQNIK